MLAPAAPYRRLREPCRSCGSSHGRIETRSGQDCMFCSDCGNFQYNAPKTETGRKARTLQSVRSISPSKRYRVLERAHGRCELCGARTELTIAHMLSVKDGFDFLTDEQLNGDDNLLALCAECNGGQSARSVPPWLAAGLLYRRAK